MANVTSREWRLQSRPVGMPKSSDFELATGSAHDPADGEVQVRNVWMSVDPYMRGRMNDAKSYAEPYKLGEAMTGGAVGEVLASNHPDYAAGDLVRSMAGWREAFTAKPEAVALEKLPAANVPPQAYLGVAGMPGMTAYAGLLRIGDPKPGETVFVSGAAGAVGSLVVQIAKIKGLKVVGSAGGPEKCEYVRSLGADAAVDYRAAGDLKGLIAALREAAPNGIDVYFDNVGGDHLSAAMDVANPFARMAICGMISIYNATKPPPGPPNMGMIIGKRLRIQGFLVWDNADMLPDFMRDMPQWIADGKIKYEETIFKGIDKAPEAFLSLFSGKNTGKMLVQLA